MRRRLQWTMEAPTPFGPFRPAGNRCRLRNFYWLNIPFPALMAAKAEVNVAAMGGEGGGLLANVNRWRGQIGLGAISENDLSQLAQSLDVSGGTATVVDFTGKDAKTGAPTRLVGAIVAQSGQTWFYKLMGDASIVARQKERFHEIHQSANYANAR